VRRLRDGAVTGIARWLVEYNSERPHEALKYRTQSEVRCDAGRITTKAVERSEHRSLPSASVDSAPDIVFRLAQDLSAC